MIQPKILVTGATGKTGAALVAELRKHDWPVRAMVSREDERSVALRRLGAETVIADMYDPEQLYLAAKGTQRAYYLPLMRPYMIQAANAFAVAAREAKLEAIVQMSQWLSSPSHPTAMTRQTWLIDRTFSMIPGVAHIIFNPGMFADNFLRVLDFPALLGIFPVLMGESRSAPISNEDMARAAAALLMDNPAKHAGRRYRPTGPELLSGREMAKVIARVVGHRVLPVALPTFLFTKVARMQKVDPYSIALLLHYAEDSKLGAFTLHGGVTEVIQELTGSPAESFETTTRRYAEMPFAQQTLGNRLRAIVNFLLTPMYPGYDLKRYIRQLEIPMPTNPLYSMQDERWLKEHAEEVTVQPTLTDADLPAKTARLATA